MTICNLDNFKKTIFLKFIACLFFKEGITIYTMGLYIYKICTINLYDSMGEVLPYIKIAVNIKSPRVYKRLFIINAFFFFLLKKNLRLITDCH